MDKKAKAKKNVKTHKKSNPEHYFILVTGKPVKNIRELADEFSGMEEWAFFHHVNDFRNDFATWIEDIFAEKDLADRLRQAKNIKDNEIIILRHLLNK